MPSRWAIQTAFSSERMVVPKSSQWIRGSLCNCGFDRERGREPLRLVGRHGATYSPTRIAQRCGTASLQRPVTTRLTQRSVTDTRTEEMGTLPGVRCASVVDSMGSQF
jgi:hypothetical protein